MVAKITSCGGLAGQLAGHLDWNWLPNFFDRKIIALDVHLAIILCTKFCVVKRANFSTKYFVNQC
jgi:hypothetical protein